MPKADIHQLEEKVLALMGEFRRLKGENQELLRQVNKLNSEKETLVEKANLSQVTQERLSKLESLSQKNEKDRRLMRTKVQSLLEGLEKFDLS